MKGFFKFKYNDETDYICKILVSMIPVALVGFLFKDQVDALFDGTLRNVAVGLLITAALLLVSDGAGKLDAGAASLNGGAAELAKGAASLNDGAAQLKYDADQDGWYMGERLDSPEAVRAALEQAGALGT